MRNYTIRPVLAFFFCLFNTSFTTPLPSDTVISRPLKFIEIDYSTIDTYARRTPESAARSLTTLSDYLTTPARSELAKVRSVYTWITSHIRYDEVAFSGQKYSSEIDYANRVLKSRKAVCTGFALLFKHLLGRAGVEVTNIKGYARTNDSEAGQPIRRIDHEWNAVRLDGDWYLLDIAWAQTTAKTGANGEILPNDFFFLTEPAAFAANHFPADTQWQLLNPPVSKLQFDQFPKIYDAYFRLGFNADFPKKGIVYANDVLTLSLKNDNNIEFMCSLGRQGGSVATNLPVKVQQSKGLYELTIPISPRGNSTLYIFAKPKGPRSERVKSFEGIIAFTVTKS